jgi:hypothetical protein
MEATTYHPIEATLPYRLGSPFLSSARPLFGMPNWAPQLKPEHLDYEGVKKPKSPSRPNQPHNAGTMPNAGRQLAAMQDHKL